MRKPTKKRLKAATKRLLFKVQSGKPLTTSDRSVIGSYHGILKWCDSWRLSNKTINKVQGGAYAGTRNTGTKAACAGVRQRHGFVRNNIRRIEKTAEDDFEGWEYEETTYTYPEYVKKQQEDGDNVKLALAELAEIVGG